MVISPDEWEQVKQLLEEALRLDSRDIPAFLNRAALDGSVRHEVERLLTYRSEAAGRSSPASALETADFDVQHRFSIGTVLCNRFRVVRFIAAGGMGEIYEARDQELQVTVAIKTIRHDLADQPAFLHRFRREVRLARQVTHPNVCRIHDLFYDSGPGGGCHFVSMEFLNGETLADRLRRTGPMTLSEAAPIISAMADALSAAHGAGILHRDFKPGNVMLVSPSDTQPGRTVVTDFGLAFRFAGESRTGDVTVHFAGTPAYMSPEQIEGGELTQASDIYALGLMMYEIVTGKAPFDTAPTGLGAMTRLYEKPVPPSSYCPDLDRTLEKAILQCLERDPSSRPQSAKEIVHTVNGIDSSSKGGGIHEYDRRSWATSLHKFRVRLALVAASLFVLLTTGTFVYFHYRTSPAQQVVPNPFSRRRTIAVLNFKNSNTRADAAWLSTALSEMLTTELGAGERLRTISGDEIAQAMIGLSVPDADASSFQTTSQIGKTLNADLIVLGSYVALSGGKLRLDLRLQNAASGEVLISAKQTGNEDDLFDLVSRAGALLREKCDAGDVTPEDQTAVRAALPTSLEASKLYSEGLAKLRLYDAIAARDLLKKAVSADPNHALAHSALAAAWSLLGYDEKARLSAKSAYELSSSLSREDRLSTEARYRETSKEWDNAATNYRTLFGFFPDSLEYGLLLARAQYRSGKGKQALETVETMRRLQLPEGNDARIDLAAAESWKSLGDFKQCEMYSAQAAQKARVQNAKVLLARALYQQGTALHNLGDTNRAMITVKEAANVYEAIGDRNGYASTLEVSGKALMNHGDYSGALAKFNEGLAIVRVIGNRRAESSFLNEMAIVLGSLGNGEEARKMYEQALSTFREVSDKDNYAQTLLNIAGIALDEGDLVGANRKYSQALDIFREVNNRSGIATSLTALGTVADAQGSPLAAKKLLEEAIALDRSVGQTEPITDKLVAFGDILQHLGDLPAARTEYQEALDSAHSAGDRSVAAYALMGLGSLELRAADLTQARKDYEEALAIRTELGEQDTIPCTKVAIAELAIEEGRPGQAEALAREAWDELGRAHKKDDQIGAARVLVNALLANGKLNEARNELSKVAPFVAKSENLSVRLAFAVARGRAKAYLRDSAEAKSILQDTLTKATMSGYVGYQLESRLILGEVDLKSGKSLSTRVRLKQLHKEANDRGFHLIAHKADELQKSLVL